MRLNILFDHATKILEQGPVRSQEVFDGFLLKPANPYTSSRARFHPHQFAHLIERVRLGAVQAEALVQHELLCRRELEHKLLELLEK